MEKPMLALHALRVTLKNNIPSKLLSFKILHGPSTQARYYHFRDQVVKSRCLPMPKLSSVQSRGGGEVI